MLAAHLSRLTERRPVRYASPYHDPDTLEAMRNYLAVTGRTSHRVGNAYHMALPQLGDLAPAAHGAFQSLMQSHHPADLAALIDLMSEHGIAVPPGDPTEVRMTHPQALLHALRSLHENMPGEQDYFRPSQFYGQGSRDVVRSGLHTPVGGDRPINLILDLLSQLKGQNHHRAVPVEHHLRQLAMDNPMSLVNMHDLGADTVHDQSLPYNTGTAGVAVKAHMENLLNNVRYHLYQQPRGA